MRSWERYGTAGPSAKAGLCVPRTGLDSALFGTAIA
jgi:hypothetical protein